MSRPQAVPPPAPIRTMAELFAVAYAMEADAVAYYTYVAADLRAQGAGDLASLFEQLAVIETGHSEMITTWSTEEGNAPPTSPPWPAPTMFDVPAEEVAQSRLLTPYKALAAAVRQEERSFAFWAYLAATAPQDGIRDAAERMAHEELEHVALLRRARRNAFHAARGASASSSATLGLRDLAARERALADMLDAAELGTGRLDALAAAARSNAARLEGGPEIELRIALADDAATQGPVAEAEFLVEAYLAFADVAGDATVVALAQSLAEDAIRRLAVLRTSSGPDGM